MVRAAGAGRLGAGAGRQVWGGRLISIALRLGQPAAGAAGRDAEPRPGQVRGRGRNSGSAPR